LGSTLPYIKAAASSSFGVSLWLWLFDMIAAIVKGVIVVVFI
jgi:hypothetical protein